MNKELNGIIGLLNEEKKYYSKKNKNIVKKDSLDAYSLFLSDEKEMFDNYQEKIINKKEEIEDLKNLEGEELFNYFSLEEKINNIRIDKKSKRKKSFLPTYLILLIIIHNNFYLYFLSMKFINLEAFNK